MQRDLLERYPDADLQIDAVWFAMVAGDARDAWALALLPDTRVRHYWGEGQLAGRWFARNVEGWDGMVWDAYYLFDADARWDDTLPAAVGSGATVLDQREALAAALLPLLAP